MTRRSCKYFVFCLFTGVWAGFCCLWVAGCSDNPEAKAAKKVRSETAGAVQGSVTDKNFGDAQQKVAATIEQEQARIPKMTKDAALLASGNLLLAKGRQMQMDLSPKAMLLHTKVGELESVLRRSEKLLLEKERVEGLLASEDQEVAELQNQLNGDGQNEGLNKQLEQVGAQREQLMSERASMQAEKEKVQAILDEHQANADALMRQAELAKGDARLDLEKQAFAILQQRKEHYVKAQTLENKIAALDGEIGLVQVKFDGLTQSIEQMKQRIEAINTSKARAELKKQMNELQSSISEMQQRLSGIAGEIATEFKSYRDMLKGVVAVYTEALTEFDEVASQDAKFSATVRMADSALHAALARSMFIRMQKDLSQRLQGLQNTADPMFVSEVAALPISGDVKADDKNDALAHFDQAIEKYEKAVEQVGRIGDDAKCSLLKSKLLALYGKMHLADLVGDYDIATSAQTAMDELIEAGQKLGPCFTLSETLQIIENEGLDYLPKPPVNVEVLIDGKKEEFSAWKNLSGSEQEAAVEDYLQQIDNLVEEFGEKAGQQLEPLKQEMLAAKERGFKAPGPGEPNSL